jgi:phosphonate transport system substrate-binding protein
VDRLSALTGVPIELKLYEDMATFEKDYQAGLPDLLFAHPSMTADAHRRQGFVPLVRDQTQIYGVLFVRKDSPYRSIPDLVGKKVAFVGARSFCSIITKDLMAAAQADLDFEEQNTGSTRNVLKAVMLGKADAGASLDVSVLAEPAELVSGLRPLATSRGMAPHPLSAHPRVAEPLRSRITAAVLGMASSPEDRALLAAVRLTEPVAADYGRDYRALERAERLP